MSVLSIVLLILGILMLIEGATVLLFPKWTWGVSKKIVKAIGNHLKAWGIAEIIIAIALIIISLRI